MEKKNRGPTTTSVVEASASVEDAARKDAEREPRTTVTEGAVEY